MKVRFRTEAASDVMSAREWYDAQRSGLGDDFVAALERVAETLESFKTVSDPKRSRTVS